MLNNNGVGKMAQQLRVLATLALDLISVLSTHMESGSQTPVTSDVKALTLSSGYCSYLHTQAQIYI